MLAALASNLIDLIEMACSSEEHIDAIDELIHPITSGEDHLEFLLLIWPTAKASHMMPMMSTKRSFESCQLLPN